MREIFSLTIQSDGKCFLYLRTPIDRQSEFCGTLLNNEETPLAETEINKKLLGMLAEAYYAGYNEAVDDGVDVVKRLLLESNQHRKPNSKISEKNYYRKN